MAKKDSKLKKMLKKEVEVKVPLPKNKVGESLRKERKIKAPRYFSESWQELKKVTWPGRKEAWKLTLAVVLFTAAFTLISVAADFGFNKIVERILL